MRSPQGRGASRADRIALLNDDNLKLSPLASIDNIDSLRGAADLPRRIMICRPCAKNSVCKLTHSVKSC